MQHKETKPPEYINYLVKASGRNPLAKKVRNSNEFHQRIVPVEKIYKRKKFTKNDFYETDEE
jgi:hypothetical protein